MSQSEQRLRQPVVVVLGHVDSGKCISGNTLLELADGRLVTAQTAFETYKKGNPTIKPDGEVYESEDLALLSVSQDGVVTQKSVTHVWKLRSNRLIKVRTRAGQDIETTPEHRFLTFCADRELKYTAAERLRVGDYLLIPAKTNTAPWIMPRIKEQILLSLSDEFLLMPDPSLNARIEEYCRDQGVHALGRSLGDKSFYFHVRKGYYRVGILRKLAERLSIPSDQLYDFIQRIKFSSRKRRASHKAFWLKVPHDDAEVGYLYYLVGLHFGDGIRGSANLSNNSQTLIREFQRCLTTVFGVRATVAWRRTSFIVDHRGGKTLSKLLVQAFGYPESDKARTLKVPALICAAPEWLLARFLQGFFDAEGYVEKRNNVGISCESRTLMRQLQILLHRYGCLSYFAKKKNRSELIISGRTNLHSFVESIGFTQTSKGKLALEALSKAISNRVFEGTPVTGDVVKAFRSSNEVHDSDQYQLNYYEKRPQLTHYALSKLLALAGNHDQATLAKTLDSFRMVEVTEIEMMEGDFTVYDFTVGETHNFLANGLIVHNTSLLDKIRGTAVQAREAGGITQEIGASFFPIETLLAISGNILNKSGGELKIPGLLVIDTPGHEIFSNLRSRGGSAADIAILLVDVQKGLENQTIESIEILKKRKVPFLVALNKIDMIKGWKKSSTGLLTAVLKEQPPEWNDELEERLYNVVGGLSRNGFDSDAFYRIKDFKKQVAIVPVSARYGVGIPELLAMLIGLAQQFLSGKLTAIELNGRARGIILELQLEPGIGQTANVILTEGTLGVGDRVVLVRMDGGFESRVKALFMPKPLDEMRDPRDKFQPVDEVYSAAGVKLVTPDLEGVIPGTQVISIKEDAELEPAKTEAQKDLQTIVSKTDTLGVIVKAGNIGGLEALLQMLKDRDIPVRMADIGDISKTEISEAAAVAEHDPYLGAIIAFDAKILPEAKEFAGNATIFTSEVIYDAVESYVQWATKAKDDAERTALATITPLAKFKALPGHFFRRNDPAVFGVEIVAGKLRPKARIMDAQGNELGVVEQIQDQGKSVPEAKVGMQVAISVKGPTLGRQIRENDVIYTFPRSHETKLLRSKYLASLGEDELATLKEISEILSATDRLYGF
jgi:translation initiation factor 5B